MTTDRALLEQAIIYLESQRDVLGAAAVEAAIASLRAKLRTLRTQGSGGVITPLVGRDAQLQQLLTLAYAALEGPATRTLLVLGSPGLGKSRLLHEFTQWLTRFPEPLRVVRCTAEPQTRNLPYTLIRTLMGVLFQFQEHDPAAVARDCLERGFQDALGAEGAEKAHFVGHLIGIEYNDSPYLAGIRDDARQIRDRALYYVAQLVAALTATTPLVLIGDDLHWADDGSLDVLEHLIQENDSTNLVLVGSARPELLERRPAWASFPQILLHPLDQQASHTLITALLHQVRSLPDSVRDLIVSQSEGNPFHIEELIKVLIAGGVIVPGPDEWRIQLSQVQSVRMPSSLTDVLHARLMTLSPSERATLERAAVIGRVFDLQPLLALSPSSQELESELRRLQARDLITDITVKGQPCQYQFKHALLHEIVYLQIDDTERRAYHACLAEWLAESVDQSRVQAGLVAEHYEKAGMELAAGGWYNRAAHHAAAIYAQEQAIDYCRRALALLPTTAERLMERIELYELLGIQFGQQARFGEATNVYTSMLQEAEAVGNVPMQARALQRLAWIYNNQGNIHAALDHALQAEALAEAGDATLELAVALFRKGWALYRLGRAQEALATGERALALCRALNARREMAFNLNLIGAAHETLDHYDEARRCKEEALALHRELGDRRGEGVMLNNLGCAASEIGDHLTAEQYFQETLQLVRVIGDREGEIYALLGLGSAQVELQRYAEAETNLQLCLRIAQASGLHKFVQARGNLALAMVGQGRTEEALLTVSHALELARQVDSQREIGQILRAMGTILTDMPEHVGAGPCFAESARIFAEIGSHGERARTLRAWAAYAQQHGNPDRAMDLLHEASTLFEKLGLEHELIRTESMVEQGE